MPELPEVETISRQLNRLIVGKKIKEVEIALPKIVKAPLADFKRALVGAKIKSVGRRAKLIILALDNGWSLLAHLKMTGQMIYVKKTIVIPAKAGIQTQNSEPGSRVTRLARRACESRREPGMTSQKYTHVIFVFTDGSRLFFNDLRQFGYLKLIKTAELAAYFIMEGFGPEPLVKDFTLADFEALLAKKPKTKIKQFLMDPKIIAGIGNIYSDEILFFSRLNPLRPAASLKKSEIKNVYAGIKKILLEAIKLKGTSASDYLDAFGQKGKFAQKLKVYGKEGEKCVKCKERIIRIKIGGRSAHFCPACQI